MLYVFSTCGFGQLVSTFTRTQVAAVFATTVLAVIPTVNFSGLLVPVSSLTGQGRLIGLIFQRPGFSRSASARSPKDSAIRISGSMRSCLRSSRRLFLAAHRHAAKAGDLRCRQPARRRIREQATRSSPKAKRPRITASRLRRHLANIYRLIIKELRGIRSDPIMLVLVAYSFTIAIYAAATGASTEATNLSIGIVDEDHSDLSRRIADGLTPPTFKPAVEIAATEIDPAMDSQRLLFVIEIPQSFRRIFSPVGSLPSKSMSMPPRSPRPPSARPTSRTLSTTT